MKKKWLQRTVTAALATAVCLSQGAFANLGSLVEVQADTTSLLTNGDFEEDIWNGAWSISVSDNNWDNFASGTIKTNSEADHVHGGKSALGIWFANDDTSVTLSQTVKLDTGTYTLSGYAKETKGVTAGVELVEAGSAYTPTTGYGEFSGSITVSEAGSYTVTVKVSGNSGAWVVLDDFALVKNSEDTSSEETVSVVNGDFETDIWTTGRGWTVTPDSWDNFSDAIKTNSETDHVHGGKSALGIWFANDDTSVTLSQTVELAAGTYALSGYAKETKGVTAGVEFVGAGSAYTPASGYGEFTGTVSVSTAGTYTLAVKVSGNKGAWVVLDDVTLKRTGDYIPPAYSYEDLQTLIASVPGDAGFTTESEAALETALAAAKACTEETAADDIVNCYTDLETALANLVYADDNIFVDKISGLSDEFIKGVDISSYIAEVNSGVVYKDWNGNEVKNEEFIKLLADAGVNYIRLRVWNQPSTADGKTYGGGNNDLATTIEICRIIKNYNDLTATTDDDIKVLIDLQYSDFWADPDKQTAPKAWKDMDIDTRCAAVKTFTTETLTEIAKTGVEIGMVQIGNETNTGICGTAIPSVDQKNFDTTDLTSYDYVKVFKAGCEGVDAYNAQTGASAKKVVHFTDPHTAGTFYAELLIKGGVDYDVYATSYYPFWHGTTSNLKDMLTSISKLTNASGNNIQVMVAETQYVHTNEDYDGADNQAYEGKNNIDLSGWSVSLQGQANEIHDVMAAVAGVGENGIGMFYWEPAWLGVGNAYDADGNIDEAALAANKVKWETYGSGWATDAAAEYDPSAAQWGGGGTNNENASLFDFYGNPLSSLKVFKYVNYGAVAKTPSYYSYNADELTNITVETGTSAQEIRSRLAQANATVGYVNNDKSTGTTSIAWSDASCTDIANKIQTTGAIGNSYLAEGTITVDGNNYTVKTKVFVAPAENLIKNGDFENGSSDWTFENGGILFVDGKNPRNGSSYGLTINCYDNTISGITADENGYYHASATQEVSGLAAGTYEVKAFFEGASGLGDAQGEELFVKVTYADKEKESEYVTLKGWMEWQCASISDIIITKEMVDNGTNTISLSIVTTIPLSSWGSVDDVYLYKVPCDADKTVTVRENEKAATYTENGSYDEVVYCATCGEELSRVSHVTDKLTKPSEGTETKPDEKPGEGTETKPEEKPGEGTETKPEEKPSEGTDTTPEEPKQDEEKQEETTQTEAEPQITVTREIATNAQDNIIEKTTTKDTTTGTTRTKVVMWEPSTGDQYVIKSTETKDGTVTYSSVFMFTNNATITKAQAKQAEELAKKKNAPLIVFVHDADGNLLYKVKLNTKDIKKNTTLSVYRYNEKTSTYSKLKKKYQTVKSDAKGNIEFDFNKTSATKRYVIVSKEQAKRIDKKIAKAK